MTVFTYFGRELMGKIADLQRRIAQVAALCGKKSVLEKFSTADGG